MLREGLHEYSYNVGFIREQYGVDSNEYGRPVFSAFHRYGMTSSLNIGARAEASDEIYNVGISTSVLAPRVGSFTLSVAKSAANGKSGRAASFQHSYQVGSFNTNFLLREFSRDYAVVSAPSTTDTAKYEVSLGTGFSLVPLGSVSLGYSKTATYGGATTQITSASYSLGLSKSASLFMTASATRVFD